MSSEPRRSYLIVAAAIVVAGALISVSLFAALRTSGPSVTTTTTTSYVTTTSVSIKTSADSTEGTQTTVTVTSTVTSTLTTVETSPIVLQISLNTTTMASSQSIRATISAFNPLALNVTALSTSNASSVISDWNQYDFLCADNFVSVVGFAILQGHYTSQNVSSATPLTLVSPEEEGIACIATGAPAPEVLFLSNSSMVELYNSQSKAFGPPVDASLTPSTSSCVTTDQTSSCGPSGSLTGYYDLYNQNATQSFHYFPAGEYTIAAEDSWGQADFAYFTVTA